MSAILAESLVILSLLLTIGVVFTSGDFASFEVSVQRSGRLVGPSAAFLFCLLGGWWAARKLGLDGAQVLNGSLLGGSVLMLHILFLIYLEAPFHPAFLAFVVANPGGGALGGWIAQRRAARFGRGTDQAVAGA